MRIKDAKKPDMTGRGTKHHPGRIKNGKSKRLSSKDGRKKEK
jgi:hypothetical protein